MKKITFTNRRSGFTLVELLAVVGIIAILASIVVSSIGNGTEAAEEAAIHRQAQVLNSALQQYKAAGGQPIGDAEMVIAALRADDELLSGVKGPFLLDDPADVMNVGGESRALIFDGNKFVYISTGDSTGDTGSGTTGGTGGSPGTSGEDDDGEVAGGGDDTLPPEGGAGGEIAYTDPSELRGTDVPFGIMGLERPYSTYELDWLAANFDLLPPAQGAPIWAQIGENFAASDPAQFQALSPLFAQGLALAKEIMPPLAFRGMEGAYLQGVTGVDAAVLLGQAVNPMNATMLANSSNAAGLRAMTVAQWDKVINSEWGGNARDHLINILDNSTNLEIDPWERIYYLDILREKEAVY